MSSAARNQFHSITAKNAKHILSKRTPLAKSKGAFLIQAHIWMFWFVAGLLYVRQGPSRSAMPVWSYVGLHLTHCRVAKLGVEENATVQCASRKWVWGCFDMLLAYHILCTCLADVRHQSCLRLAPACVAVLQFPSPVVHLLCMFLCHIPILSNHVTNLCIDLL